MNEQNLEDSLRIRPIRNNIEYDQILEVRRMVFVREQNVPIEIEFDGFDKGATHIIVRNYNKTIGCARIRSINKKMKLERIAILKEYRNEGFGTKLLEYLISYGKEVKVEEIILNAQCYLKSFYEGFGFKIIGETFIEAGIKHIEMHMPNPEL